MTAVSSFFGVRRFSDVQLSLVETESGETKLISAHKVTLSGASPFFDTLFDSGFKERIAKVVELKVDDIEVAMKLIAWMYGRDPILPAGTEALARQWMMLGPEEMRLPWPGGRPKFHLRCYHKTDLYLGRSIFDQSTREYNEHAFVDKLDFVVEDDGIYVEIKFDWAVTGAKEYLQQFDCKFEHDAYKSRTKAKDAEKLIREIIKHSQFPPDVHERIQKYLED